MPPRCAGNAGMGSKVDASGSSSMGDVFQWFRPGDGSWGQRSTKAAEKKEAWLSVAGLPSGLSTDQLKKHFDAYYSTVRQVTMVKPGTAQVLFGFAGERDKALVEMQGRPLNGCPLHLSTHAPQGAVQIAGAKRGRGPISDSEIQRLLLERQKMRSQRDYRTADAYSAELKQHGVLLDNAAATWRAADGRTGYIPQGGVGGVRGHGVAAAEDDSKLMYVQLAGQESMGTHTLKKILAPFNVEEVKPAAGGYAVVTFADAEAAARALALDHYSPVGVKLVVLTAAQYREAVFVPAPPPPLPAGWACDWSVEHGRTYYYNTTLGVTQWEAPKAAGLVAYSDEEEEGEEAEAAPAGDAGWFYGDVSGEVHGPYPENVVSGWVALGALLPETPVCKVGGDAFVPLRDSALADVLPSHMKDSRAAESEPMAVEAPALAAEAPVQEVATSAEENEPATETSAGEKAAAKKAPPPAKGETAATAPEEPPAKQKKAPPPAKGETAATAPEESPAKQKKAPPPAKGETAATAPEESPAKQKKATPPAKGETAATALEESPAKQKATPPAKGETAAAAPEQSPAKQKEKRGAKKGGDKAAPVEPTNELLTPTDLAKLKVAELKELLKEKGLDSNGKKQELIDRLLG